jgi:hypothetical protein
LLSILTLPFSEGNISKVLSQPHSLVITEKWPEICRRCCPSKPNACGRQTLKVDNKDDYTIGVLKDIPENSSVKFRGSSHWRIM